MNKGKNNTIKINISLSTRSEEMDPTLKHLTSLIAMSFLDVVSIAAIVELNPNINIIIRPNIIRNLTIKTEKTIVMMIMNIINRKWSKNNRI